MIQTADAIEPADDTVRRVLILCTGNSCRSQMAEGLINSELKSQWKADSAGSEPSGYVHPLAVRAMQEIGIDISIGRSKSVNEFRSQTFHRVITVCDHAAENCPVWLGAGKTIHIGFDDPAVASGSDVEKMKVFRRVRDEIRTQVLDHLRSA